MGSGPPPLPKVQNRFARMVWAQSDSQRGVRLLTAA
jgi:hypothetical protein